MVFAVLTEPVSLHLFLPDSPVILQKMPRSVVANAAQERKNARKAAIFNFKPDHNIRTAFDIYQGANRSITGGIARSIRGPGNDRNWVVCSLTAFGNEDCLSCRSLDQSMATARRPRAVVRRKTLATRKPSFVSWPPNVCYWEAKRPADQQIFAQRSVAPPPSMTVVKPVALTFMTTRSPDQGAGHSVIRTCRVA